MTNKELIEKFPWLTPSNRWSGKWITDCAGPDGEEGYWPHSPEEHPDYNYDFTELDDMPEGWRIAFGEQMCEEINQEWLTWPEDKRKRFRITQIKEKYGSLRFYTNYTSDSLHRIINKYEYKSRRICIRCGKPARWISRGWISPWCDDCARSDYENSAWKHEFNFEDEYADINNYY